MDDSHVSSGTLDTSVGSEAESPEVEAISRCVEATRAVNEQLRAASAALRVMTRNVDTATAVADVWHGVWRGEDRARLD